MTVKQTAGRRDLGEFAPEFAHLNDDILFGEVWNRTAALSLRDRSLVTVTTLMAQGLVDSSFQYHLQTAKNNGITRTEIAEILTHAAFYAGWPKAWAAFRLAKEVWTENKEPAGHGGLFGLGEPNTAFAPYFIGNSYLKMLTTSGVPIANVTFEPGCRNNWHVHHALSGGGQLVYPSCDRGARRRNSQRMAGSCHRRRVRFTAAGRGKRVTAWKVNSSSEAVLFQPCPSRQPFREIHPDSR